MEALARSSESLSGCCYKFASHRQHTKGETWLHSVGTAEVRWLTGRRFASNAGRGLVMSRNRRRRHRLLNHPLRRHFRHRRRRRQFRQLRPG